MCKKEDGDLSRQVYENYGRAAHAAVELERSLVNLALLLEPLPGDGEGEFSGFFKAWDGSPAPSVDRLAARLGWESTPLRKAVETRTFLRDKFWQENSEKMQYFDGKRKLVDKLKKLGDQLISLNERLSEEASRIFLRYGLTENLILEAVEKTVGREESKPIQNKERIVSCVAFRQKDRKDGYVPALKCADGRLLLITRDGLKPGISGPDADKCVDFIHLAKHFPSVLSGPVEFSSPWCWKVPLGNRLELYVERGGGKEKKSVQWGVRNRADTEDTIVEDRS